MGTGLSHWRDVTFRHTVVAAVTLALLGCGTDGPTSLGPTEALLSDDLDEGRGRVVLVPDANDASLPRDPVNIGAVSIEGDTIQIRVAFGGGCAEHRLRLLVETTWMESYPVQVPARLAHDANDDACDAVINGTLRFDLSPLKRMYQAAYQTASGKISLRLAGAEGVPVYEF